MLRAIIRLIFGGPKSQPVYIVRQSLPAGKPSYTSGAMGPKPAPGKLINS